MKCWFRVDVECPVQSQLLDSNHCVACASWFSNTIALRHAVSMEMLANIASNESDGYAGNKEDRPEIG